MAHPGARQIVRGARRAASVTSASRPSVLARIGAGEDAVDEFHAFGMACRGGAEEGTGCLRGTCLFHRSSAAGATPANADHLDLHTLFTATAVARFTATTVARRLRRRTRGRPGRYTGRVGGHDVHGNAGPYHSAGSWAVGPVSAPRAEGLRSRCCGMSRWWGAGGGPGVDVDRRGSVLL